MAHQFPLKPGYQAEDLGIFSGSTEADRRGQDIAPARNIGSNYHGEYPAADQSRAEGGRLWKVGQATPNEFLSAPFSVVSMNGDGTTVNDEIHEIDCDVYGDGYDSTSPIRVRTVAPAENHWSLDSDHDGHRN